VTRLDPAVLEAAVAALTDAALADVVAVVAWPDPAAGRDADGRPRAALVGHQHGSTRSTRTG